MKKFGSLILALVLVLSIGSVAFADDYPLGGVGDPGGRNSAAINAQTKGGRESVPHKDLVTPDKLIWQGSPVIGETPETETEYPCCPYCGEDECFCAAEWIVEIYLGTTIILGKEIPVPYADVFPVNCEHEGCVNCAPEPTGDKVGLWLAVQVAKLLLDEGVGVYSIPFSDAPTK